MKRGIIVYAAHVREICFIIGDFNIPGIVWESQNTSTDRENRFMQVIQDNYLTQLRIQSNPFPLDLLITGRDKLISDISYMDPLGNSDHLLIGLFISAEVELTYKQHTKYRMHRGNYEEMNIHFNSMERKEERRGHSSVLAVNCTGISEITG